MHKVGQMDWFMSCFEEWTEIENENKTFHTICSKSSDTIIINFIIIIIIYFI